MKKVNFQGYKGYEKEHQFMFAIHNKINNNDWKQADIEDFVDKWAKHILNADMKFDTYFKKETVCAD